MSCQGVYGILPAPFQTQADDFDVLAGSRRNPVLHSAAGQYAEPTIQILDIIVCLRQIPVIHGLDDEPMELIVKVLKILRVMFMEVHR